MSNVVELQRVPRLLCASPPSEAMARDLDLDVASPMGVWRAVVVEEVRNSVLLLDLATQHARLMTERVFDEQARQNLIGKIETIERQLQRARDMTRGL